MSGFTLRPEQQRVIDEYRGGYAAISAVPGAGKTTTLSALAASLIERIEPRQRVVIVTYQNAAVSNFQRAVAQRLNERSMPQRGFVVRTLHSLASEVLQSVRHRAELDVAARVIDEVDARHLLDGVIQSATQRHRGSLLELIVDPTAPDAWKWPADEYVLRNVAQKAIDELHHRNVDVDALREHCAGSGRWLPFALDVCQEYQIALRERGYLTYDDLVVRAVDALERDPKLCARLRKRWPYLLEDEAQDSNRLLERMLTLLAGEGGNLVRVGDPNQAILTTFTNSSVDGFRRWLADENVQQFGLAGSSRSTDAILRLANRFVERVQHNFPVTEAQRTALLRQPITAVEHLGARQNPRTPDSTTNGIETRVFDRTETERAEVLDRAVRYLRKYPDRTVAILVGSKNVGYEYSAAVAGLGFPDEMIIRLLSGKDGRPVGLISRLIPIINFLEQPDRTTWLVDALSEWSELRGADRVVVAVGNIRRGSSASLSELLYPQGDAEVGSGLDLPADLSFAEQRTLERLRAVPSWLENRLAMPHELLALIASTIQPDDMDRSLLDAIVTTVASVTPDPAVSRLQQLTTLLTEIQKRHRQLRGTHEEHEIKIEPGTLTISTRHQAKGLEWDIVFAIGCDDFWFRSSLDYIRMGTQTFLGPFDPVLAMVTELRFAQQGRSDSPLPEDITETTRHQAIAEVSEGLRIMYVTITRARIGLWVSWHKDGTSGPVRKPRSESLVFPMLVDLVNEVRTEALSVAAD